MVSAYAAHVVEEWFGGFPEWFGLLAGRPLPHDAFLIINAVGLAVMAAAARAATGRETLGWLAIGIATVIIVNGSAHLLGSIVTGRYSPGLFTGIVLYLPLGELALTRAWSQVPHVFFWRGVAAGVAAHTVVTMTALASA
jgi:sorbitol-specific phosphotransferase system component IIC